MPARNAQAVIFNHALQFGGGVRVNVPIRFDFFVSDSSNPGEDAREIALGERANRVELHAQRLAPWRNRSRICRGSQRSERRLNELTSSDHIYPGQNTIPKDPGTGDELENSAESAQWQPFDESGHLADLALRHPNLSDNDRLYGPRLRVPDDAGGALKLLATCWI